MANSTSGPEHPLPNRIHKGKQKGRDHVGQERLHNRGIMSYWFLQQIHKDKDNKTGYKTSHYGISASKSEQGMWSDWEKANPISNPHLMSNCNSDIILNFSGALVRYFFWSQDLKGRDILPHFKHGYFQFVNNLHFFCLDLWKNE